VEIGLLIGNLLRLLVLALIVLVFGRVLVSWVDPRGSNELSRFLVQVTEPILAPVRRLMPSTGAVDLSATIVLIALFIVLRAL
jgi:YggT family protein